MKSWLFIAIMTSMASASLFTPAYAQTGECTTENIIARNVSIDFNQPLEWMLCPFEAQIGEWINPILWGAIFGVIYLRVENPMLVGLVGLLVFASFVGTAVMTDTATGQLFFYGALLLAVGVGFAIFRMVWFRARNTGSE